MTVLILMLVLFAFVAASIVYVYKYRGQQRYENFSEYVRKGWPIFTPFNCLLYMFTQSRARKSIMNTADFSELDEVTKNWRVIQKEAEQLYQQGYFDQIKKPGASSFYDIGFRTFYKYGWSKFYLNWYGYTHDSAKRLCPKTVEILSRVPTVKGAMFSILPVGSKLTRHLDPVATSLRYHLGLSTPNSDKCFINVDGKDYSWRDGEAFIFDETYLHYANNNAERYRLILMCDVERPLFLIGKVINFFYRFLMRLTIVPNLDGDRRGLANAIFSGLAPVLQKTKNLKQTNKGLYLVIKHSVNFTLLVIVVGLVYGLLNLFYGLTQFLV